MKIINPLYDLAFKYLMENERMAKLVLSTILDEDIEELSVGQQETIVDDEKRKLSLFRLDFKALIKKYDGTKHTVLIELQKSKFPTDIERFRLYLGSNYMKGMTEINKDGEKVQKHYPIITIYILGYKLPEIERLAVTAVPNLIDSVTKEPLSVKSDFVNSLTHRSHILQVQNLPEERVTKLERFMMFFNQAWVTDENFIIDLEEVPEEFVELARYMQGPLNNESFRNKLISEQQIDRAFDEQEAKYLKKIERAEKEVVEAKAREKEAKVREEKTQELNRILIHALYASGKSIEEIANIIHMTVAEIEKIIKP